MADLNGDRLRDLAVSNAGDGTVSVLLGSTNGFHPAASYAAGNEPADITAGDFDRDGDMDLVVANHETSNMTVLINDGQGRFPASARRSISTGARPHVHSVTAADLDGDGWLDVSVESADTREVRICKGGRDGFSPPMVVPVGAMPYSRLGFADVSGDGIADILVPGHDDRTVRSVRREGGSFTASQFAIVTGEQPWSVMAGWITGSKNVDLVVLESGAASVWRRPADPYQAVLHSRVLVPGATGMALGKVDGDDRDDVVVGSWDGTELAIIASGDGTTHRIRACGRPIGLAIVEDANNQAGDVIVACATENRVVVLSSPLW